MMWAFWLYACIAAPWVAVMLMYGLRSPWRRSATGWGQFGTYLSLSVVLVLAAVFLIVPVPRPVAVPLSVAVLGAVGLAGVGQLVNVLRLQRRDRR